MKILLINNYQNNNETATYEALKIALAGHQVKTQRYKPGLKFEDFGKDLVILSGGGGEGSEINDEYKRHKLWYDDQIDFILSTNKPILGICMGFEVIARAYNSKILEMKDYITGYKKLTAAKSSTQGADRHNLRQYENHKWFVPSVSHKHFEVLAYSGSGIEMIKHKTKKITATQFHPEKGGTLQLKQIVAGL
jgi:anthranilate/para-aminobenzoate synthase component II